MPAFPKFPDDCQSLLRRHLTPQVFDALKHAHTPHGFTLEEAIASGVEHPDSSIGVYAGDAESYDTFRDLFDPIIEDYHRLSPTDVHRHDRQVDHLESADLDADGHYIQSTRIRVARNLATLPLGPGISNSQRREVEQTVTQALLTLPGNLEGYYHPLHGMTQAKEAQLIADHFLFRAGDRFLESAGLNRDWPHARGIFHNQGKTFLVWINEEDHLRVISMQQGGDIRQVFERLVGALDHLEQSLTFAVSERLGHITSCPTNLGTAMRASVHIKLPKLAAQMDRFKDIADAHHLQIRGIHGEHSESEGGVYDVSNRRRLGITEVACVQGLHDGVAALIAAEGEL